MHLFSLAALALFNGLHREGAYDLVDESVLFGATDISVLRTPLWIPQGLWAFGIFRVSAADSAAAAGDGRC